MIANNASGKRGPKGVVAILKIDMRTEIVVHNKDLNPLDLLPNPSTYPRNE